MQVLQYNPLTNGWLKIGEIGEARKLHAVVEANLAALCTAIGNIALTLDFEYLCGLGPGLSTKPILKSRHINRRRASRNREHN